MRRGIFQWVASFAFVIQMYLTMAIMAVAFAPWALIDRRGAYAGVHTYTAWVRW
ncbi:MAG: 1-acyl-sn-glycerol-3-phosphate acyltransferase, partial [Gammaproteobacteria bacterium]|nr:1-acyl-sn-glycerol-3-phosphate acyltransferase [Gammaproteobacteria bacterium]